MNVHDTGIPCPVCHEGAVQWAKINFHRAEDNAFSWRLDAWCSVCGHGLADREEIMREIRLRYNDQLGREIFAVQEAALVQRIGPRLNRWFSRRAAELKIPCDVSRETQRLM